MFTDQEMSSLKFCAEDQTLEDHDREMINSVMHKIAMIHSAPKPQIIVTIDGGCFQYATASTDIELIIEDLEDINELGGLLFFASLAGDTPEQFEAKLQSAKRNVMMQRSKDQVNSVRIFVADHEDLYPFQVMVDDEMIGQFKSFEDAFDFLKEYIAR